MGRQYRSPRRGASATYGVQPMVTSSSAVTTIPNYGITDMSTWTAGEYVMDAPDTGVRKTLFRASSTAAAVIVRGSSGTSVSIGSYATTAATQITFGSSTDMCMTLIGQNSTHWIVESAYCGLTVNTTSIIIAGS